MHGLWPSLLIECGNLRHHASATQLSTVNQWCAVHEHTRLPVRRCNGSPLLCHALPDAGSPHASYTEAPRLPADVQLSSWYRRTPRCTVLLLSLDLPSGTVSDREVLRGMIDRSEPRFSTISRAADSGVLDGLPAPPLRNRL